VTESDKASIAEAIAGAAGVDPSAVVITVVASSVRIVAEIVFASAEVRNDGRASLTRAMATRESATALLSDTQVTVLQAPTIVAVDEPAPVGSDSDGGLGTVLAAAAGATVLVTLAGSLLLWRRQHTGPKRARSPPKTQTGSVPATPPPQQPPLVPSSEASVAAAVSASEVEPSHLLQDNGAAIGIALEQESGTLSLAVTTASEPARAINNNPTHLPVAYSPQGHMKDGPPPSLSQGVVSEAEAPKPSSMADEGPTKADGPSTGPPAAVSERNTALAQALSRASMAESSLVSLPRDSERNTALAQAPDPDVQPSNLFLELSARLSTAFKAGTSAFSMDMPGVVEDARANGPSSIDC